MRALNQFIASNILRIRVPQSQNIGYVTREISNVPPIKKNRQLNVLSQFQRPSPRTPLKDVIGGSGPQDGSNVNTSKSDGEGRKDVDTFKTTSTNPVVSSIQEIPSRSTSNQGIKSVNTIPAMKDVPPASIKVDRDDTRKETKIQGIVLPPKPIPPGEEECCMSGCVNCVYTIYADDLELYNAAVESIKESLINSNVPEEDWPDQIKSKSKMDEGEIKDKIVNEVDPVMSAFLALENKLKQK